MVATPEQSTSVEAADTEKLLVPIGIDGVLKRQAFGIGFPLSPSSCVASIL